MHVRETSTPPQLLELLELSVRLGNDLRLVQGAGGNLSAKLDGTLWIKASGTRLAQARDREIYVPMDERATREAVLRTEDLAPYVRREARDSGLRPSIETALHVLLPHRFVVHVHGTGAIAAGLTDGITDAVRALPADVDTVVVPYAKPGVMLARAVLAATGGRSDGDRPVVLVLRNHGVVVGASTVEQADDLLARVESTFRRTGAPSMTATGAPASLCPPGTVDATAADVLCAGALTPDSAVFLGPTPFTRIPAGPPPAEEQRHAAFVADDGSVWVRPDLGDDEREIVASLVDVARQVPEAPVSALSPGQVDELVNWEAEQWRRQQKR